MMNQSIRIGTVGTSKIMRIIQDAMRHVDGIDCSVVYSRELSRAEAFARDMEAAGSGPLKITDSFDDLVTREDVDVVYLASPNRLHYEQAMRVMRAGKPVIIEKPVAILAEKVEDLHAAALEHNVMFLEAISTLYMPNYLKLKNEILPRLGKLKKVRVAYGRYSSQYDAYKRGENPNVFSPAMEGGALNDMGVYCVHVAVDLFGEPDEVTCERSYGPDGADLCDEVVLYYKKDPLYGGDEGLTVQIGTSKITNILNGIWLEGENGSFSFDNGEMHDFVNGGRAVIGGGEIILAEQGDENRMVYEQAAMRDCLLADDRPFFEKMYNQTLRVVKVLERAHADAAKRRR